MESSRVFAPATRESTVLLSEAVALYRSRARSAYQRDTSFQLSGPPIRTRITTPFESEANGSARTFGVVSRDHTYRVRPPDVYVIRLKSRFSSRIRGLIEDGTSRTNRALPIDTPGVNTYVCAKSSFNTGLRSSTANSTSRMVPTSMPERDMRTTF